jgi:hypothetical protein
MTIETDDTAELAARYRSSRGPFHVFHPAARPVDVTGGDVDVDTSMDMTALLEHNDADEAQHRANLADVGRRYADVTDSASIRAYLERLPLDR